MRIDPIQLSRASRAATRTLIQFMFLASMAVASSATPPAITSVEPTVVQPGVSNTVRVNGSGFALDAVALVNGAPAPAIRINSREMTVQVTLPATAAGSVELQIQNPSPSGASAGFNEAVSAQIGFGAAARILDQTTFGPTWPLILHVQAEGASAWLNEQFNAPPTVLPTLPVPFPAACFSATRCVQSGWWSAALSGNDQLRQRVAFA